MRFDFDYEKCINVYWVERRQGDNVTLLWENIEQFGKAHIELYRTPFVFHTEDDERLRIPTSWKLPEGTVELLERDFYEKKEDSLYYRTPDYISDKNIYDSPLVYENKLVLVSRLGDFKIKLVDFNQVKPICKIDIPTDQFFVNFVVPHDIMCMVVLVSEDGEHTSLPRFISGFDKRYYEE